MDLAAYAQLIIRAAIDLRPGQELFVDGELDDAPLVRALAEAAYAAGAKYVDVNYSDPWVHRAFVAGAPDGSLTYSPAGLVARLERGIQAGSPFIRIHSASNENILDGLDGDRLGRARMDALRKTWLAGVMGRNMPWVIVSNPNEQWATEMFGEPDLDRLIRAFSHAMRLDLPDPAAAWKERLDELSARAEVLSERAFDAIHYSGPGTDLTVGLVPGARWISGRGETLDGQTYVANMPTEECFTSPDMNRADGVVRSSKPLLIRGGVVEGLALTLEGGRIVDVRADKGKDVVEADLATDDGARRFGELALVDDSSRVGQTGEIFRNTLFDENAASHIAWGQAYTWAIDHLPEGDYPLNSSATHVDFMIGSDELEIDGIEPGGEAIPLLRGGAWQLS